jgi:hypothetical protein
MLFAFRTFLGISWFPYIALPLILFPSISCICNLCLYIDSSQEMHPFQYSNIFFKVPLFPITWLPGSKYSFYSIQRSIPFNSIQRRFWHWKCIKEAACDFANHTGSRMWQVNSCASSLQPMWGRHYTVEHRPITEKGILKRVSVSIFKISK